MTTHAFSLTSAEQAIVGILRRLPSERALELLDFAHFLDLQTAVSDSPWDGPAVVEGGRLASTTGDEEWEMLLARPDARETMRIMASEALAEYRAGRTTEIGITEDGRLAPT